MRAEHSSTVRIAASRQQVWDRLTAWESQDEWIPLTRVRRTGGTPGAVGEMLTARTGVGPLAFDDTMTVLEAEEPVRCRVAHTGRVVRGVGEFRLTELPGATRLEWWEEVDVPGGRLAPLLWRAMSPVIRIGFALALRRLARRVERAGPGWTVARSSATMVWPAARGVIARPTCAATTTTSGAYPSETVTTCSSGSPWRPSSRDCPG
jgi:carbon monoxide dehydrogenase subunit G